MDVQAIFSFLVHPSKHDDKQPDIGGTRIPLAGNLSAMLSRQFANAQEECNIDIAFLPSPDGVQSNDCRNAILSVLLTPELQTARILAERLQSVTTHRSGLGLFFLIIGIDGRSQQIYLSRYPADFGIIAEEKHATLHVELIEKVFMKNALAYKAVVYEGTNHTSGFWTGKAIDRQVNNSAVAISGYWIREFLQSDFKTTSATGTRRLALALKETIDGTDDLEIKEQLSAAARLAQSLDGQPITIDNFGERFALSKKSRDAVAGHLTSPSLRFDQFIFSAEEFGKHIRYRSVSINNGAVLTAPVNRFNDCFTKTLITQGQNEYEFKTRGLVVNDRLKTNPR